MTAFNVHYTTPAYDDLTSILLWVANQHGQASAERVDLTLERAISSLEKMANRGRQVPELRNRGFREHRELVVTPYRIVYCVIERDVWLIAILDRRRNVMDLLLQRAHRFGTQLP